MNHIGTRIRRAALVLALGLAGTGTAAANQLAVQSLVEMETVTVVDGKKQVVRTPVTKAVPGSEIIFSVVFTNNSTKPASNVALVNPVPEGTTYVAGSAEAPGVTVTYSVDGGKVYGAPEKLVVKEQGESRPAIAKDYTHIRWVFKDALQPGKKGQASFRAVLE